MFYEVGKHPTKNSKGSKTLFASGTVLDETIYIPDEEQWRGGKRWLIKRAVSPDYAVLPPKGVPLAVLRKIRGKKGWPQSGFRIKDVEKFEQLEKELINRQESYNKDISINIKEGSAFIKKAPKQFQ